MNLKCLMILFAFFISCKDEKRNIRIDKYLTNHSKKIENKIIQTNFYDQKLNLIIKNEYSRVGCNMVDSSVYIYGSSNRLIELYHFTPVQNIINCKSEFGLRDHIKYNYDGKGKLLRSQILKGVDLHISLNNNITSQMMVKDSLHLLTEYLSDINLITQNISLENIERKTVKSVKIVLYRVNDIPSVLMDYGIPINELLKTVTTYIKNGQLVRDEFRFNGFLLIRKYRYDNDVLQEVIIESSKISEDYNRVFIESFHKSEK